MFGGILLLTERVRTKFVILGSSAERLMTMADVTSTPTPTPSAAAAPASGVASPPPARKAPAKPTAGAARPAAKREAAKAQPRAAKPPARPVERFTLIGLGAALEARDRVVSFATDWYETFAEPLTTRQGATKQLRKFERRGSTERNRLERRAKSYRTRVQREIRARGREAESFVRRNRVRVEHEAREIERTAEQRQSVVSERVADISHRVETAVHAGYEAGEKVAKQAVEQLTARA